jgi:hypothetical protein
MSVDTKIWLVENHIVQVDPRALAGIERKVARADEHMRFLYDEMSAWTTRRPWHLSRDVHDEGRKHFFRVRLDEPIPVEWAVVLGELLHDLRSALDQAVYWLTVDWTGRPLKLSSFPVYRKKADFRAWSKRHKTWSLTGGMYKIRGVGPGPHAFIEALQPYPQRDRWFYCRDLRTVHDLWNEDKHRLVHLWGLRFRDPDVRLRPHVAADCVVGFDRRVLQECAIVLKVTCGSPHAEVEMKGQVAADLTIRSGKRRSGGVNESLWDTTGTVVDVIRKLTNAIGRQDAPINMDAWTAKRRPTLS